MQGQDAVLVASRKGCGTGPPPTALCLGVKVTGEATRWPV